MKNLALIETHKLTRLLATQRRALASLEASAADFLAFYPAAAALVLVGDKLACRWPVDDARAPARLHGAGTLEEIEAVLLELVDTLAAWQSVQSPLHALRVRVFHHVPDEPEVKITRLEPFSEWAPVASRAGYPPLLNVAPWALLREFAHHYLYAALHERFYEALMAENQQRMQHMDQAVRRIEQESDALRLRRNGLRREEIIEEIEVIMLNVETLNGAP